MTPLFETILEHVEDPEGDDNKPMQFLITILHMITMLVS